MKVQDVAARLQSAKADLATHSTRLGTLKVSGTGENIQLFTDNIWFTMNRAKFIEIQEQRLAELENQVQTYEGLLATLQETLDRELGNVQS